ncbi:hypothetical protein F4821DRAFT_263549 [Hypoxylon rubiginosum]|uniref:Uncharacterized protein n=1 Tax=Hypoxylon rubiginosum TaxID=110542 RepID=A0ACC0CQU1_9PEZI|nr:hypothetical protein F4821DRAFT_263549 [Hypoxylon rubiginosum]
MPSSQVKDKQGETICEGDVVWTKARGGRREGDVHRVVESTDRVAGVRNPPKVLFKDQHGHNVAHNPGTLEHKELA